MSTKKTPGLSEEAREWFRLQGAYGGTQAASNMSAKARKARARKAARTRWAKKQEAAK